jgi:hypothetical protein
LSFFANSQPHGFDWPATYPGSILAHLLREQVEQLPIRHGVCDKPSVVHKDGVKLPIEIVRVFGREIELRIGLDADANYRTVKLFGICDRIHDFPPLWAERVADLI